MVSSYAIRLNKLFKITKLTAQDKYIKPGSILIVLFGPDRGRIYQHIIDENVQENIGKVNILRPDMIDEDYLYLLLSSNRYEISWDRNNLLQRTKTVEYRFLHCESISLPNLSVQKEIVQVYRKADSILEMRRKADSLLQQTFNAMFISFFGDPSQNPKGFKTASLRDVLTINPSKTGIVVSDDLSAPYVKLENLMVEGYILSEYRKVGEMRESSYSYFANGDVLFPTISPSLENGKGCVASDLERNIGFGSREIAVLRPMSGVTHSFWIHRLLSLPSSRKYAARFMTGSTGRQRISVSFIKSWKVPVPPFEIQRKFADVIHSMNKIQKKQSHTKEQLLQLFNHSQNIFL
ncbi:restriction endonuclease subunit S [Paenibacillus sp. FSL R7-0198]|uniref:restriction endonuclease subunit S n=1 Tax=Paenibacillus sp. FSL R7-0198 TaxID=2921674 RepID=UPI0030F4BABD